MLPKWIQNRASIKQIVVEKRLEVENLVNSMTAMGLLITSIERHHSFRVIGGLCTRISMTTILTNECGVGGGPARPIHQSAGRLSSSRSLHSLVQPSMGKPHVIIRSRRRCAVDLVSGTHSMWPHDFPCAITHPFVWPPGPAQHVAATDPIIDQGV